MKVAMFKKMGQPLAIEEVPEPTPAPGQVVLKVGRCGICGSDLQMTGHADHLVPPDSVLGHEFSGEVVALGTGVEGLAEKDRVAVLPLVSCGKCPNCLNGEPAWCAERKIDGGGYGQYTVVREAQCLKLPASVSLEDGALVEPLAVGLHGVAVSGLKPGERVLVIGAGPIGLATIFWARRHGAGPIAATASSTRRAALAGEMGASVFLPSAENLGAAINQALGGPPDIIFECVGKPGILAQAIDLVRPRGTVVLMGLCWSLDSFVPGVSVAKEVRIQPAAFYSVREFQVSIDAFDAGNLEPRSMITDRISLAELPAAFEALRRRTTQCKVMVDSWAE